MANQTRYAGTVTQSFTIGPIQWETPQRASGNNLSTYASATNPNFGGGETWSLVAEDYDFAIPSGSTILGIQLHIVGQYDTQYTGDQLNQLSVVDNTLSIGGKSISPLGGLLSYDNVSTFHIYGGDSDTLGYSWTASEINDPTFSVIFNALITNPLFDISNPQPAGSTTLKIYAIEMTVEYEEGVSSLFQPFPTCIQNWYFEAEINWLAGCVQEWYIGVDTSAFPKMAVGSIVDTEPTTEERLYHLIESRSNPFTKGDVQLTIERLVRVELEDSTE